MRLSKAFLKTYKESPKEAELASHQLMLRTSMIKQLTRGVYSYLPLGYRVLRKIENITREEMNRAGAQEEVVTDIVRNMVSSYKDLPFNLYQIQTKFRDEIRPRFGLMRGREFVMKDAYSFHINQESLDEEYQNMKSAYERIFKMTSYMMTLQIMPQILKRLKVLLS